MKHSFPMPGTQQFLQTMFENYSSAIYYKEVFSVGTQEKEVTLFGRVGEGFLQ